LELGVWIIDTFQVSRDREKQAQPRHKVGKADTIGISEKAVLALWATSSSDMAVTGQRGHRDLAQLKQKSKWSFSLLPQVCHSFHNVIYIP
jgi:hypothetical protein